MIEANVFLAMFAIQIVTVSLLYASRVIRYARTHVKDFPAERLAELEPGVDQDQSVARFARSYRTVNIAVAAAGLIVLGWLIDDLSDAVWNEGRVNVIVTVYFILQMLPLCVIGWLAVRRSKALKNALPETKRTASLERRGLFDFISPLPVSLAILLYVLFALFVIYLCQYPFPGFAGFINIGAVTLVYALNAFGVFTMLYGSRRLAPLETQDNRWHSISLVVKSSVYSCIAVVLFLSLFMGLAVLHLKKWEPLALSAFYVVSIGMCWIVMNTPPRRPTNGSSVMLRPGIE